MNVEIRERDDVPGTIEGLSEAGSLEVRMIWAVVDGTRFSVLVSRDPINTDRQAPDLRWHISVAGERDVPRWRYLVAIAHKLRPGVVFVVGVPPRSWWMSVHPHCLHLWETRDENLTEQWRAEGRGDTPS